MRSSRAAPESSPQAHRPKPDLPPPKLTVGPVGWVRANLFATWSDALLTFGAAVLLFYAVPPILNWAFFNADFEGTGRDACDSGGACWVFVRIRFEQFIYGFYPVAERWRPNLTAALGMAGLIYALSPLRGRKWAALFMMLPYPILAFVLLHGGILGLRLVPTHLWGGLLLTLVISAVGMVGSLPLGILLALGRRSAMPVIRLLCVGFIEFIRAVPLITILFMSLVILPLFLPPGSNFDQLLRALIGVTLFASAYMAEVVRGGLQAVPQGQYEAARALGLGYWKMMRLIVLPQALRIVIPAIVSTFIALFKDTTLVLIIGLSDMLQMIQLGVSDAQWIGMATEGYVFAALVYFVFCYSMSRYAAYLEERLGTGRRY